MRESIIVANSRGETLTLIDLNQNRKFGDIQMFWITLTEGFYPISVATDNANVLISAETAEGIGKIARLLLPFRGISSPATLGIFENNIDPATALVSLANGAGVLLAQSDGRTALWETQTSQLVLARQDFSSLHGAVGAGTDFFVVQNNLLNASLVPQRAFDDAVGGQESSGFALMPDNMAVRSLRPASGNGSGTLQRFDSRDPNILLNAVRMVESPPPAFLDSFPFTRTLAALPNGGLVSTGTGGIVEFTEDFDTGLRTPRISAITNPANFKTDTATGGLITIFGENLSDQTLSAETTPLPTTLGGTCVSMNGLGLPLLYVSRTQINAQASFALGGGVSTIVHNQGGLSDIFLSSLFAAAPAVFSVAGPDNGQYAAVFRLKNNQISTLSNPFRHNEVGVIFLTGMGGGNAARARRLRRTRVAVVRHDDRPAYQRGWGRRDSALLRSGAGFRWLVPDQLSDPGRRPLRPAGRGFSDSRLGHRDFLREDRRVVLATPGASLNSSRAFY